MILPAMGVISEVVARLLAQERLRYTAIAVSSLGIAFVGFLTWGHHMFVAGIVELRRRRLRRALDVRRHLLGHQGLHLGRHAVQAAPSRFSTPLLYFFGFLFLFVFGGMTGVAVATQSLDVHWHDTYFVVAHFHFIMVGGTLTAFLAASTTGSRRCSGASTPSAGAWCRRRCLPRLLRHVLPAVPARQRGMPRRYYQYPAQFQWLNVLSTAGATAGGRLLIIAHLPGRGARATAGASPPAIPWGSRGFEWLTPRRRPSTTSSSIPSSITQAARYKRPRHGPLRGSIPCRRAPGSRDALAHHFSRSTSRRSHAARDVAVPRDRNLAVRRALHRIRRLPQSSRWPSRKRASTWTCCSARSTPTC